MSVYGGLVPLGYSPFPCRRCDSLHFTIPVPAWQGDLTAGGERMYSRGEKSIRCIVFGRDLSLDDSRPNQEIR